MTDASARIVAGIGFATAASADELIGLIERCLEEAGLAPEALAAIGTHARKRGWAVPIVVAGHFGVPLRLLDDAELAGESVAEAVAAAAGPLRLGKRKSRYATCALADCRPGFNVASFGQPPSPRAEMASSIVATSSAGP
ncbi:cobalamin biosynthesis protein [Devosia sp. SL43]|uniref:cobalamin biosynthesis protein n=1 Tax=Devosia sp. SL43 TaxID=2806348 RepID=UPI001F1FE04B|nr:cobalamin biosynthesis protein [Devosia sp. SL43]UJW85209.1 cobalamin biosynthesis protein [Devosia sp. SL43]